MITVKKAGKESRKRDLKRGRIVVTIGEHSWHLTVQEAIYFLKRMERALK